MLTGNEFARAYKRRYFRRWFGRALAETLAFEKRRGIWVNLAGALATIIGTELFVDEVSGWGYALAAVLGALGLILLVFCACLVFAPAILDWEQKNWGNIVVSVSLRHKGGIPFLEFSLPRRGEKMLPVDVRRKHDHLARLRFVPKNVTRELGPFPMEIHLGRGRKFVIKDVGNDTMLVESTGIRRPGLIEAELYYEPGGVEE